MLRTGKWARRRAAGRRDDAEWTRTALGGRAYYVLRRHIPNARWTLTAMIPVEDVSAQSRYVTIVLIALAVLILAAIVL